jgi:hypothetical protein
MPLLLTPNSLLSVQRIDTLASSSWFGGLMLVILVALALSVSVHRKQYSLYVRNLINRQGRVMNYDQESTSTWAHLLLLFVVISSFTLLIISYYPQAKFFLIFGLLCAYLAFKWILIRFIGYVFNLKVVTQSFLTDYFVILALFGILLLPVVCGIIYLPQTPNLVWAILLSTLGIIVLITLFIKLLQIFYAGIGSLLYIFLYLCTSEILPLFVAVKIAQMW